MRKILGVLAAAGLPSTAGAQSVEIEPGATTVAPGEAVRLSVFGDPGPADYAIAGINFRVDATGGDWAALRIHVPPPPGPHQPHPGVIMGSSVTGISVGQLDPTFGVEPLPGRIRLWSAEFSSATAGVFDITTTTSRMAVYIEPEPPGGPWPRRDVTPTEAFAQVTVIPAPAAPALLGLGGLAAARRHRRAVLPGLIEEGEIS